MLREIVVQNLSTNESHSEEDPTDFQKLASPANTNTQNPSSLHQKQTTAVGTLFFLLE
jgi:hypothetical protein